MKFNSCSKNMAIALALSFIIAAVVFGYFWKKEHERQECDMNLREIYNAICASASMENISPGEPIPGGVRKLIERITLKPLPTCPSGGTYSFANETTYTWDGVNENVRCSHAVDLGHVWSSK